MAFMIKMFDVLSKFITKLFYSLHISRNQTENKTWNFKKCRDLKYLLDNIQPHWKFKKM